MLANLPSRLVPSEPVCLYQLGPPGERSRLSETRMLSRSTFFFFRYGPRRDLKKSLTTRHGPLVHSLLQVNHSMLSRNRLVSLSRNRRSFLETPFAFMHAGFSSFIQLLCGARFRGKGTSDLTHCIHSGRGGTKSLDKRKGGKWNILPILKRHGHNYYIRQGLEASYH